jgi:hypothetical protein
MKKTSCETCRHWTSLNADPEHGNCRRFPPPPDKGWTRLHRDQWCGEWSAIPAPKEKKETDPNVTALVKYYAVIFEDIYGSKPRIAWKTDGAHAKKILAGRTYDEAKAIVREFLEEPPKWNADKRLLDFKFIPGAVNTILARRK